MLPLLSVFPVVTTFVTFIMCWQVVKIFWLLPLIKILVIIIIDGSNLLGRYFSTCYFHPPLFVHYFTLSMSSFSYYTLSLFILISFEHFLLIHSYLENVEGSEIEVDACYHWSSLQCLAIVSFPPYCSILTLKMFYRSDGYHSAPFLPLALHISYYLILFWRW